MVVIALMREYPPLGGRSVAAFVKLVEDDYPLFELSRNRLRSYGYRADGVHDGSVVRAVDGSLYMVRWVMPHHRALWQLWRHREEFRIPLIDLSKPPSN